MRHIVLLLSLGFIMCNLTYAQIGSVENEKKTQRQIDKLFRYINAYDSIPSRIKTPLEFWRYIKMGNYLYVDYVNDNSKFKQKKRLEFANIAAQYIDNQSVIDTTLNRYYPQELRLKGISILEDRGRTMNAYVDPFGHISVTPELLKRLTSDEITAIIAHETAHFMLLHSEIGYFAEQSKRRSNEVAAIIAGAMVTAGYAYSASIGGNVNPNEVVYHTANVMQGVVNSTIRYTYKYSREYELVADVIATRYLQWLGIDRLALMAALQKMADDDIAYGYSIHYTDVYDSHPSLLFRIKFLEALLDENRKPCTKLYTDPLYSPI